MNHNFHEFEHEKRSVVTVKMRYIFFELVTKSKEEELLLLFFVTLPPFCCTLYYIFKSTTIPL